MHQLILVRHGQSEPNARGALVGRSDHGLTDLGRSQAGALARQLAAEALRWPDGGRILSSPLLRARDTAGAILAELQRAGAANGPAEIDDRLVELDYGGLDGLLPAEVDAAVWAAWRADPAFRPAGGETLAELQERCNLLFDELQAGALEEHDKRVVVAVSHVSPIKAAVVWALGVDPRISWKLQLPVAAITRIALGRRGPALVSFGETLRRDEGSA